MKNSFGKTYEYSVPMDFHCMKKKQKPRAERTPPGFVYAQNSVRFLISINLKVNVLRFKTQEFICVPCRETDLSVWFFQKLNATNPFTKNGVPGVK